MTETAANMHNDIALKHIPITKIVTNPYQPRKIFKEEAIRELAGSIANLGLLQPITVRELENGYELIAGERRLRACKMLGYTTIPAIIDNIANKDSAMLSLIENLQRENLHFFEEAEAYLSLLREHGLTQEELARKISKKQSTIANKLRLLKLPKAVKTAVLRYSLTERHARSILRLHNEETQLNVIKKIHEEGLSVKNTEKLVERELTKLYGEEQENNSRFRINYRLYYNTVRKLVSRFRGMGEEVSCNYDDTGQMVNITISFNKKH